jgi:hypothetical protein
MSNYRVSPSPFSPPPLPKARRPAIKQIFAEALEAATVAPFGWVLGGPGPTERSFELGQAHSSAALDTWSVHCFDPGHHGQTEVCAFHAPFMHGEQRQGTAMPNVSSQGRWLGLSIGEFKQGRGFRVCHDALCS